MTWAKLVLIALSISKAIDCACFQDIGLGFEFALHAVQTMVARIVSRQKNLFRPGLIDEVNGLAQVLIGNAAPGRFACAKHRLSLNAGPVSPAAGHRKV